MRMMTCRDVKMAPLCRLIIMATGEPTTDLQLERYIYRQWVHELHKFGSCTTYSTRFILPQSFGLE